MRQVVAWFPLRPVCNFVLGLCACSLLATGPQSSALLPSTSSIPTTFMGRTPMPTNSTPIWPLHEEGEEALFSMKPHRKNALVCPPRFLANSFFYHLCLQIVSSRSSGSPRTSQRSERNRKTDYLLTSSSRSVISPECPRYPRQLDECQAKVAT